MFTRGAVPGWARVHGSARGRAARLHQQRGRARRLRRLLGGRARPLPRRGPRAAADGGGHRADRDPRLRPGLLGLERAARPRVAARAGARRRPAADDRRVRRLRRRPGRGAPATLTYPAAGYAHLHDGHPRPGVRLEPRRHPRRRARRPAGARRDDPRHPRSARPTTTRASSPMRPSRSTPRAALEQVDATRIGVTGISQGGGTALAVGALVPRVRAVVARVPFLCDFPRSTTITNSASVRRDPRLPRHAPGRRGGGLPHARLHRRRALRQARHGAGALHRRADGSDRAAVRRLRGPQRLRRARRTCGSGGSTATRAAGRTTTSPRSGSSPGRSRPRSADRPGHRFSRSTPRSAARGCGRRRGARRSAPPPR